MGDGVEEVSRSVELAVPPEQVWNAITDPDAAASWFGDRLAVEPRRGGRVSLGDGAGTRRGTVEQIECARRLTLRVWSAPRPAAALEGSRIDFVLEPLDSGGTRLTVTETRLSGRARLLAGSSVA